MLKRIKKWLGLSQASVMPGPTEDKRALLGALRRIEKEEKINIGICGHLASFETRGGHGREALRTHLMMQWPKGTGDSLHPIHSYSARMSPAERFYTCCGMWDEDTMYGRARWELLRWMISELEKECE